MTPHIIQVERWHDTGMAFVRVRDYEAPETDKDVIRPIDYNIFEGTHVPSEHQFRAGALVALMFFYQKRAVLLVEVRWLKSGALWIADAQIDEGDQIVYRRGTGATPVDALTALAFDIQYE